MRSQNLPSMVGKPVWRITYRKVDKESSCLILSTNMDLKELVVKTEDTELMKAQTQDIYHQKLIISIQAK